MSKSHPKTQVHQPLAHDSAVAHVTGRATYLDDIPEPAGCLHAYVGCSEIAHGEILAMDLDAVRQCPGVVDVITATDIPGANDISPMHTQDEELLCSGTVNFHGQVLFAVAATSRLAARRAARQAVIRYQELPAVLDIETAMQQKSYVAEPYEMQRGDFRQALDDAPHRLQGELNLGGQDHFYLEGQAALAIPRENDELQVHSSTQHPSELQHLVAQTLNRSDHAVTVEVRRMGGAFGGKETQAAQWAMLVSLLADRNQRAVKIRLDRDDDMSCTGKRHPFRIRYRAGFDDQGRIRGVDFELAALCGLSADLSAPISDRAMFHCDNAYFLPSVRIRSYRCRSHTVSNTAFRGFGGPQGMMAIERVMDDIAATLNLDPLAVRRSNLYDPMSAIGDRSTTHYGMPVEDNILPELLQELETSSEYQQRRIAVEQHNRQRPIKRRGIALTPIKFGISFTTTFLNQAGALVHVYKDGSIQLNHGGTEMGQGLFIKVAQVVADGFGLGMDAIRVTATNTGKVPNTSATAASSGTDMNAMAALNAVDKIKARLAACAEQHFAVAADQWVFEQGIVRAGDKSVAFAELVMLAYLDRVSLSATGFYRTPKIHFDRVSGNGRPFLYFAWGAAVSEVEVDTQTGENRIRRVDILHDAGRSLNPAIDIGQIEGGFVQGAGWLTTEELWWDDRGALRTHAPSTYKIPLCGDVPAEFHTAIFQRGENVEETIHRSKAVGEPPLMLAISVHSAIRQAISGMSPHSQKLPTLDAPATAEQILRCMPS